MSEIEQRKLYCQSCLQETDSRSQKGRCPSCQAAFARRCEHWEMAFWVAESTIFVKCMNCDTTAQTGVDGNNIFTTNRAKMALTASANSEDMHGNV
jgi:hypothetical protein